MYMMNLKTAMYLTYARLQVWYCTTQCFHFRRHCLQRVDWEHLTAKDDVVELLWDGLKQDGSCRLHRAVTSTDAVHMCTDQQHVNGFQRPTRLALQQHTQHLSNEFSFTCSLMRTTLTILVSECPIKSASHAASSKTCSSIHFSFSYNKLPPSEHGIRVPGKYWAK